MASENTPISKVIVGFFNRLNRLESQIGQLIHDQSEERRFVSSEQLEEITAKVEQNITRNIQKYMDATSGERS